jgi:hypothetical protein
MQKYNPFSALIILLTACFCLWYNFLMIRPGADRSIVSWSKLTKTNALGIGKGAIPAILSKIKQKCLCNDVSSQQKYQTYEACSWFSGKAFTVCSLMISAYPLYLSV